MALRVTFNKTTPKPITPRVPTNITTPARGQITGPMCHEYGIRGYGNPDPGVIVVGIAPGRDEQESTKRPFTGASGRLLDDLLRFSGWSREKVYATNCICWLNNAPTPDEVHECSPRLYYELTEYNPRLIVTMGQIANETITGAKRRKGSRGSVTWSDRWKCYVLDTHHPSYALQAQSLSVVQDIARDLSKIPDVLTWRRDGSHANVAYYAVQTLNEAQRALNMLPRTSPVMLDIETSNPDIEDIDAYSDQLLCFALSFVREDKEYNYVFPQSIFPECVRNGTHVRAYRQHGKCGACDLPEHVFEWPKDVKWSFQAGHYDIHGLHIYFGVQLPLYDDTMLMSYCIDERPGYHGLKDNAREFLGAGWYEAEVKPFYKGRMHLLPPEALNTYNAKDAAYTRRLAPIFRRRMEDDSTVGLYNDLLLPATRVFLDQKIRGINIDYDHLNELSLAGDGKGWFSRRNKMLEELAAEAQRLGWPTSDFNNESPLQMRQMFIDILGVEPTKWSQKTGQPSFDKETLDQIKHPFAAQIRECRTIETIVDYVLTVRRHVKYDGLLHPTASVTTTRTGRTSYRDPAMQTIPKPYTVGADYARLREVIIPHNPDTHEIIEADYCLAPATRVLKSDLTWVPIGDVVEGDILVGFDEELLGRDSKFCESVVERVKRVTKPCYRIITDRGTVVASDDHMWCAITDKYRTFHGINLQRKRWWWHTSQLEPGDRISYLCDPWEVDTSYEGGYIAGFLDGEGFCSRILGFGQNIGPTLNCVLDILKRKGFDTREKSRNEGFTNYWFAGQGAALRALGTFRPVRLLPKGRYLWDGVQTWSKNSKPATVLHVEYVGEQEVVAVQTSSKTFIAEGMLSHNCQIEVWLAWAESRDPTLLEHLQSGDVHSRTAEGAFNVQRSDFTPARWSEYRQNAKRIRFGLQYGEGAEKLSSPPPIGLGCSVPEARKYVMGFWRTYPSHRKWTLDIQKQVVEDGYLRTPTGRVMRFPMVLDHKSLRQAINFPIQANASDYCLKAMIKLAPMLKELDAYILLMIHDALVVESPKHRRAQVVELIRQVMTEAQLPGYPSVGVEVAVGPNLGRMEKV